MKHTFSCLALAVLLLSACSKSDEGESAGGEAESAEALGSYDINPESGEVRATHTDAAGVTTTMRAGKDVPVELVDPFLPYPGAELVTTTRVDQGDGSFVTLDFTTPDNRNQVVAFYRELALDAGIEPEIDISGENSTTLGGENRDSRISFTLSVRSDGNRTEGQLSVASGFE